MFHVESRACDGLRVVLEAWVRVSVRPVSLGGRVRAMKTPREWAIEALEAVPIPEESRERAIAQLGLVVMRVRLELREEIGLTIQRVLA